MFSNISWLQVSIMAAESAKVTRLSLIDEIYNFQLLNGMKVGIKGGKEFTEATIGTLEQLLGVSRKDLKGEQAIIFDKEVLDFSLHLPQFWLKCSAKKRLLIRKHGVWVNHEISLQTPNVVPENPIQNGADIGAVAENAANIANLAENVANFLAENPELHEVNNFFKLYLIIRLSDLIS